MSAPVFHFYLALEQCHHVIQVQRLTITVGIQVQLCTMATGIQVHHRTMVTGTQVQHRTMVTGIQVQLCTAAGTQVLKSDSGTQVHIVFDSEIQVQVRNLCPSPNSGNPALLSSLSSGNPALVL